MAEGLLIQRMPTNTRSENLNERRRYGCVEPDTKECLEVSKGSRPTKSENLHISRRQGFVGPGTEVVELSKDTRRPSPITSRSEGQHDRKRHGYFEKDQTEAIPLEPIQYWFYPAEQFPRFQYIYNQTMDCKSRVEKVGKIGIQTHQMPKNVIIKIGIIGEFTDNDSNLISKRKGKKTNAKGKTIWNAEPLVCFSESKKDDLNLQSACHKILITSRTLSDTHKADDSFIVVGHNKKQIKEAITTCLEEPLRHMLQEWLEVFKTEPIYRNTSGIVDEIEAICKQMEFINSKNTKVSFLLPSLDTKSIVPEDVKDYLFGMPYVHSFGIWRNSSFKVFVNKTDEKRLRDDLTKMNPKFFNKYNIEIENGKLKDKLSHLKQGDKIQAKMSYDDQNFHAGTLGGIVTKVNDKSKKYALTCNHLFPMVGERAYNENLEDIGTCLYTTKEKSCDFAAIEIENSFSEKCDETFQNEDRKITNALVFSDSVKNVGIVHKIGATTKVTKGIILSSEYYDKLFDDNNREHVFLVKGIPGNFSKEGDSGSLVFTSSKDAQRACVYVLGMVYGNKVTVYGDDYDDVDDDDDDDDDQKSKNEDDNESSNTFSSEGDNAASNFKEGENISSCFRIHIALELFKQNKGEEVKFKDDLLLSSPEMSSESDDSNEETPQ